MRERFAQAEPTECVQFISEPAGGFRHRRCQATDEAAAFKTWLREISQKIAETAVEGSFLVWPVITSWCGNGCLYAGLPTTLSGLMGL